MKKSVIFIFAVILGTGAGLLVSLCFQITEITDQSMLPSYESGERVMINRFAFAGEREPHRGDVILMKFMRCPGRIQSWQNGSSAQRAIAS